MGSDGTIPESYARTVDKKQLAAWIKEGLIAHRRAEKLYALPPRAKPGSGRECLETSRTTSLRKLTTDATPTGCATVCGYDPVAAWLAAQGPS